MGMIEVSIPQKKMFKEEKQVKSTFKVNMADPSSGVQLTGIYTECLEFKKSIY